MLAIAPVLLLKVVILERGTLGGMAIALASAADGDIADGVEVRPQDDGIAEHFVAESVEAVERDENVRGRDPFLEHWTALELVRARSTFQSTEGHRAASQRRNVAELVRAQWNVLPLALNDSSVRQAVHFFAVGAVELEGNPLGALVSSLVDGEALGPWRVEFDLHVSDIE